MIATAARITFASVALSASFLAGSFQPSAAEAASSFTASQAAVCSAEEAHAAKTAGKLQSFIDGPGKVRIVNSHATCAFEVGAATYRMAGDGSLAQQQLHKFNDFVIEPGTTRSVEVGLPDCATQLDVYYGKHIESFSGGRGYWNTGWNNQDRKLTPQGTMEYNQNKPCPNENHEVPFVPAAAVYPLLGAVAFGGARLIRRVRGA